MGQDRKFTDEEKLFALQAVQRFRDRWELSERNNLKADIHRKVHHITVDKHYKEVNEVLDLQELEEQAVKAILPKEGSESLSED